MRPRGIIKDILIIYIGYRIIRVWITGEEISTLVGIGTLALMGFAGLFLLERFKT